MSVSALVVEIRPSARSVKVVVGVLDQITRMTKSEISVWLKDLCTGVKKGRYSINDLKIYVA